jgi:thiol:disulfide interchange protein DsbD
MFRFTLLLSSILACLIWPATAAAQAESSVFTDALARGPLFVAAAAFGFGLLVSLTPCVYPMVAITVSVFGARESTSRLQSFGLSGAFLLGLVAMFTPLGITAGMTGKTFGAELSNPWVLVGLSVFFLILAASMFGAFDLDLPHSLKNRLAGAGGAGYAGAFVLGLVCGPITAPCTGPFLGGLLAWIAQTQSVALGTAAMVAFSLGLGTPFFLVGAFAMQLPKSGRWMVHIKSLMGIILVVVALYFLAIAFPTLRGWVSPASWFLGVSGGVIAVGLLLGAIHKSFDASELGEKLQKGIGVALVCFGAFGLLSGLTTPERSLTWEYPAEGQDLWSHVTDSRARARTEQRPLFMDFTAAWCAACKEIELQTFPDDRVQSAAGRFMSLKLDMTDDSDPAVEKTFEEFGIRGLPTLILFDSAGKEVKRFGDFVPAEVLAAAMQAVQ